MLFGARYHLSNLLAHIIRKTLMKAIIFLVSLLGVFAFQIAPTGSIWIGTKIGEMHQLIMNFATCMTHAGTFPRFDISTPEGIRLDNIRATMDRLSRCSIWNVIVCGPWNHLKASINLLMLLRENPLLVTYVAASPFRCAFKLMCVSSQILKDNIPFLRCDQELYESNPFPGLPSTFGNLNPLQPFPAGVPHPLVSSLPNPPYGALNLQGSGIPAGPSSSFPGSLNFPPFPPNGAGSPFPQFPNSNGLDALPQFPDLSNILNAPPTNFIQPGKDKTEETTTEKFAKEQLSGIQFDFEKDIFLGIDKGSSSDSASSKKLEESLGLR